MQPLETFIWFLLLVTGAYWVVSVYVSSLDARRLPKIDRIGWAIVAAGTLIVFIPIWYVLVDAREDAYYASSSDQMKLWAAEVFLVMIMIICWMNVNKRVKKSK